MVYFSINQIIIAFKSLKKYSNATFRFTNSCGVSRFKISLKGSSSAINKIFDNVSENILLTQRTET